MTKKITYICDVCGAESDRPFKLHLVANLGSKSGPDTTLYADVCTTHCAVKFAEKAAEQAGIKTYEDPNSNMTVAS
jgi:hypothetical protein